MGEENIWYIRWRLGRGIWSLDIKVVGEFGRSWGTWLRIGRCGSCE